MKHSILKMTFNLVFTYAFIFWSTFFNFKMTL